MSRKRQVKGDRQKKAGEDRGRPGASPFALAHPPPPPDVPCAALFARLVEIVAILRGPHGCLWDKQQTLASLKPCLLEEAYEVLETIDKGETEKLRGELGDLMMNLCLLAQIAGEQGQFTIADALTSINEKLVRRHPHVFGEVEVSSVREVLRNWEAIKRGESDDGKPRSLLDDIPATLPALMLADKVQRRWARVGFDWDSAGPAMDKLREEIREVEGARQSGDERRVAEEVGDLLFAAVNVARLSGVDAEDALRQTVAKVRERFTKVEEAARRSGKPLSEMSLEEMDAVWETAKKEQ